MLRLINEQNRLKQRALAMMYPAFSKGFEAAIPVGWRQCHIKQFSKLPVKVPQPALRTLHNPNSKIRDFLQTAGHFMQGFAFAEPGFSGNQSKAALLGHGTDTTFKRLLTGKRIKS